MARRNQLCSVDGCYRYAKFNGTCLAHARDSEFAFDERPDISWYTSPAFGSGPFNNSPGGGGTDAPSSPALFRTPPLPLPPSRAGDAGSGDILRTSRSRAHSDPAAGRMRGDAARLQPPFWSEALYPHHPDRESSYFRYYPRVISGGVYGSLDDPPPMGVTRSSRDWNSSRWREDVEAGESIVDPLTRSPSTGPLSFRQSYLAADYTGDPRNASFQSFSSGRFPSYAHGDRPEGARLIRKVEKRGSSLQESLNKQPPRMSPEGARERTGDQYSAGSPALHVERVAYRSTQRAKQQATRREMEKASCQEDAEQPGDVAGARPSHELHQEADVQHEERTSAGAKKKQKEGYILMNPSSAEESSEAAPSVSDTATTKTAARSGRSSAAIAPPIDRHGRERKPTKWPRRRKCSVEGCPNISKTRGLCKRHGGGERCGYSGCNNSAKTGGLCIRHGGGQCKMDDCTTGARPGGYCTLHARMLKNRPSATSSASSSSFAPSPHSQKISELPSSAGVFAPSSSSSSPPSKRRASATSAS